MFIMDCWTCEAYSLNRNEGGCEVTILYPVWMKRFWRTIGHVKCNFVGIISILDPKKKYSIHIEYSHNTLYRASIEPKKV